MESLDALQALKDHPEETGIFLDLDGTLAELVDLPESVKLPPRTREYLARLADRYLSIVIISGRAASAIQGIVQLPHLTYVGNHGLEVIESDERTVWLPAPFASQMRALGELLRQSIDRPGVALELKELSHAIHYRGAPDPAEARTRILSALEALPLEDVRIREGKFLVQLRPDASLDKGTAVERLVRERGIERVLYAGDDTTDLDAFWSIGNLMGEGDIEGHRVAVWYPDTPPELLEQGDLSADGIQDIQALLGWLAQSERTGSGRGGQRGTGIS